MDRLRPILLVLLALALGAGAPARAQPGTGTPRLERQAPESLRRFVGELPLPERRALVRRLQRMDGRERRRFFEHWETLSESERGERRERWLRELRAGEGEVDLPEEMQRRWRSLDPELRDDVRGELRRLPADERRRLRRALENWERLGPAQRDRVRGFVDRLERFSKERRERIERNRGTWEEMEAGRRRELRRRLERFRSLESGQQEELVKRRFGDRSAEDQAKILERLRRGEPPR